jgi:hypothetical protein
MIKAARKRPMSNGGRRAIACWFNRVAEKNAQDHEHRIAGVRYYCPAEKEDVDARNSPGNWPAPFLILLFVWNVGRKCGEFSPKHRKVQQVGQDDSDDSFPAEMG